MNKSNKYLIVLLQDSFCQWYPFSLPTGSELKYFIFPLVPLFSRSSNARNGFFRNTLFHSFLLISIMLQTLIIATIYWILPMLQALCHLMLFSLSHLTLLRVLWNKGHCPHFINKEAGPWPLYWGHINKKW